MSGDCTMMKTMFGRAIRFAAPAWVWSVVELAKSSSSSGGDMLGILVARPPLRACSRRRRRAPASGPRAGAGRTPPTTTRRPAPHNRNVRQTSRSDCSAQVSKGVTQAQYM